MAGQHFAGNLRVAWLVRTEQSDSGETEEEEKSAEPDEQKKLAKAILAEAHAE
jgi:hypothetical protein